MTDLPSNILAIVKDNPIVQWACIALVLLFISSHAATKLKGPVGVLARWLRRIGDRRTQREIEERQSSRQRLLEQAQEGREYVARELSDLRSKVEELLEDRETLADLVEVHLGWDYDRKIQLIELGVPVSLIPPAPPLRLKRPQVSGS